jgi:hypothetical protein
MPVMLLADFLGTGGRKIGRGVLGPGDSMALTFDLLANRVQMVGGRVLNCSQDCDPFIEDVAPEVGERVAPSRPRAEPAATEAELSRLADGGEAWRHDYYR